MAASAPKLSALNTQNNLKFAIPTKIKFYDFINVCRLKYLRIETSFFSRANHLAIQTLLVTINFYYSQFFTEDFTLALWQPPAAATGSAPGPLRNDPIAKPAVVVKMATWTWHVGCFIWHAPKWRHPIKNRKIYLKRVQTAIQGNRAHGDRASQGLLPFLIILLDFLRHVEVFFNQIVAVGRF